MKFLIIYICYIILSHIFFIVNIYLAFSSVALAFIYIRKIRVGCISEKIPVKFLTLYRNEKSRMFFQPVKKRKNGKKSCTVLGSISIVSSMGGLVIDNVQWCSFPLLSVWGVFMIWMRSLRSSLPVFNVFLA